MFVNNGVYIHCYDLHCAVVLHTASRSRLRSSRLRTSLFTRPQTFIQIWLQIWELKSRIYINQYFDLSYHLNTSFISENLFERHSRRVLYVAWPIKLHFGTLPLVHAINVNAIVNEIWKRNTNRMQW